MSSLNEIGNLCVPFQLLRDVSVNLVLMLTRKIIHILFAM